MSEQFAKQYRDDPLAPDVAYILAESTLQMGQFSEAANAFEQLIASQKEHPSRDAWSLRLGHARYLNGDLDKAILQMLKLSKATKEKEVKAEALFLVGASLMKQEKFPEAEDALQQSIQATPKWAQADEAHLILAQAQMRPEKTKEAQATLDRLIKDYPNSRFRPQAEFRKAQLLASTGDFEQALSNYDAVLQSNQEKNIKEVAAYGKAWVLMQQQKYAEALPLLEPIATADRNDSIASEANLALAICYRNQKKPKEAISRLERLVNQAAAASLPQAKALYELGLTYAEMKDHAQAAKTFERLIQEFPKLDNLDKILYEYAWSLKELDRHADASAAFSRLSKTYPNSPLAAEADYHLGQRAYEDSAYDRAVVAYTSAVTRTKDAELQEKSLYKLGWSYFQQEDFEQSAAQFAKQTRAFPEGPLANEALFMQAECMLKQKNYPQAFLLYQQARQSIESKSKASPVSDEIRTLTYLHGAQAAREQKKWQDVDAWLDALLKKFPDSPYKPFATYELAFSAQSQKKLDRAIELYTEVARITGTKWAHAPVSCSVNSTLPKRTSPRRFQNSKRSCMVSALPRPQPTSRIGKPARPSKLVDAAKYSLAISPSAKSKGCSNRPKLFPVRPRQSPSTRASRPSQEPPREPRPREQVVNGRSCWTRPRVPYHLLRCRRLVHNVLA